MKNNKPMCTKVELQASIGGTIFLLGEVVPLTHLRVSVAQFPSSRINYIF
jgi:hypothetical protein